MSQFNNYWLNKEIDFENRPTYKDLILRKKNLTLIPEELADIQAWMPKGVDADELIELLRSEIQCVE